MILPTLSHLGRRWRKWFSLGSRGERLATAHLRKQGYRIVARNLAAGKAEIDILALAPDGKVIVVVEVKTTGTSRGGQAVELRVDLKKQRMLILAATRLARRYHLENRSFRYDVLVVEFSSKGPAVLRHIPGAFGLPA